MSAPSWGKDGSKSLVKCFYCDEQLRKDNLPRHSSKKHPGMKPRSKIIIPAGQRSLFFPNAASNEVLSKTPTPADVEKNESLITETDDKEEKQEQQEHLNMSYLQRKRQRKEASTSDNDDGAFGHYAAASINEKLDEFKSDVIKLLDERLKDLAIEKGSAFSVSSNTNEKEQDDCSITREEINACKSLRQLISLVEHEFIFDFVNNMVHCKLCITDSNKTKGLGDSKVGVFNFDYALYEEQAEFSENQPNSLKRLKAHINEHIHESRTH